MKKQKKDWCTVTIVVIVLVLAAPTYCENNSTSDIKESLPTKYHEQNRFLKLICRDDTTLVVGVDTELSEGQAIGKIRGTYMVMINNRDASKLPSKTVYLIKKPIATIKNLHPDTTYNISADLLTEHFQYTAKNYFMEFQTLDENYVPGNVTNIYTEEFSLSDDGNGVNVVIQWDPSEERTCSYNLLFHSRDLDTENEVFSVREFNQPDELYRHELKQLAFGTEYAIGVQALNTKNETLKSEIWWHIINTPSCLELYKDNVSVCAPYHPENITVVVESIESIADDRYKLNVSWEIAGNVPDNYTIEIIDYQSGSSPQLFNISNGTTVSVQLNDVQINGLDFELFLTAHSEGGESTAIHRGKIDPAVLYQPSSYGFSTLKIVMLVIGPIFAAAVVIILVKLKLNQRAKSVRDQNRNRIFGELETKSPNDPLYDNQFRTKEQLDQMCALQSDFNFEDDAMELDPKSVKILEVLGEGAFGCVKRAILLPSKHVVAVKMLKKCPVYADVKNFYREIEVMKSVPQHPNIIGIIGHCTKNIFELMLFTEYCSEGNLLNFLRKIYDDQLLETDLERIQILKPNIYFTHEMRKDSAYASTSSSRISIVENHGYGCDSLASRMCIVENHGYGFDIGNNHVEKAITENDLLSFAHQVANGMDFLSEKKVVHRDLACRNVLVLPDRTIKISDFGLSRDIYQESVYQKTGSGMLPIKWLAIESMTHQTYTTYSDVWSFGVLLYEIVTKGGVPYPTVDSKDILNYLQAGKRMERPNGCRADVYQLMRCCWKDVATERPTFKNIKDDLEQIMSEMSSQNVM